MALPPLTSSGRNVQAPVCLCLKWFPFEEKCYCLTSLPPHLAKSASTPSLCRESIDEKKLAKQRDRSVARGLSKLGLSQMPSCQHLRDKSCRESLMKARTTGEVDALRTALLNARKQLGLDDPLVLQIGKLFSKAEHGLRSCRDVLARQSLAGLPLAISELEHVTKKVRQLGLGPRLWEDPFLSLACEKVKAWRAHQPLMEKFIAQLRSSPESYCEAWASFALSNSDAKLDFGSAVTKELLELPGGGMLLVGALRKAIRNASVPAEDEYGAKLLCIARASNMLLNLDKPELGILLLKREESALQAAGAKEDMMVFFMICQALTSQLLLIKPQLQRQLEHTTTAATLDTLSTQKRAAATLGKMLSVPPSDLCLHRLSNGGLTLRLFPETGIQPSLQQAQELLGNGVMLQSESNLKQFSLDSWNPANHLRSLYETIVLCRQARDTDFSLRAESDQAAANVARAEARLAESETELEQCSSRLSDAEQAAAAAKKIEMQTMMASREALMKEDATDEEVDAAKKADVEAQAKSEKAKQNEIDAKNDLEKARATKERASSELKVLMNVAVAKASDAAIADAAAKTAFQNYRVVMRGPISAQRQNSKRMPSRTNATSSMASCNAD